MRIFLNIQIVFILFIFPLEINAKIIFKDFFKINKNNKILENNIIAKCNEYKFIDINELFTFEWDQFNIYRSGEYSKSYEIISMNKIIGIEENNEVFKIICDKDMIINHNSNIKIMVYNLKYEYGFGKDKILLKIIDTSIYNKYINKINSINTFDNFKGIWYGETKPQINDIFLNNFLNFTITKEGFVLGDYTYYLYHNNYEILNLLAGGIIKICGIIDNENSINLDLLNYNNEKIGTISINLNDKNNLLIATTILSNYKLTYLKDIKIENKDTDFLNVKINIRKL